MYYGSSTFGQAVGALNVDSATGQIQRGQRLTVFSVDAAAYPRPRTCEGASINAVTPFIRRIYGDATLPGIGTLSSAASNIQFPPACGEAIYLVGWRR